MWPKATLHLQVESDMSMGRLFIPLYLPDPLPALPPSDSSLPSKDILRLGGTDKGDTTIASICLGSTFHSPFHLPHQPHTSKKVI
jgi:hypothetical protein